MRLDLNIELLYQKCDRNAKRIAKSAQLFILFSIVQKIQKNQPYEATHLSRHLITSNPLVVHTRNSWVIIWNWIYLYPDQADYITQAVIINYCDQRDGCHSDIRIW